MLVVFCKNLIQLLEVLLFIREMNEPVMVTQAALFTRNSSYRVVHVLAVFLHSIILYSSRQVIIFKKNITLF